MRPIILPLLLLAACSVSEDTAPSETTAPASKKPAPPRVEPDAITVDHILIAYNGAPRIRGVTRSLADARKLAYELVDRIEAGADWNALKKEYSDDPGPTGDGGGPYEMMNHGKSRRGVRPRSGMVPAFGDVGFALEIGEIRVADHDLVKSPFGYHIIKRVK